MASSSPRYGWPIAEGSDPRRNHPAVVDSPRTLGIETELGRVDDATVAAAAEQTRASTDTFPAGSMQSLGMSATVAAAPQGVYAVSWRLVLSAAGGTTGNLRILVNGVNVTGDALCDLDTARRPVSGTHYFTYDGVAGSVAVSPQFQAASASGTVHEKSWIGVCRVGV